MLKNIISSSDEYKTINEIFYILLFILSLESCCAGDNSHSTLNQPQLLNSHTVASGCLCWVVWF